MWVKHNNIFKAIKFSVLVLGLMAIIGLCGCSKKDEIDLSNMTLSASIVYEKDNWEVYKSNTDNKIIALKNGRIERESTYSSDALPIISLPSVTSSKDLDRSTMISENIYDVSNVSALEYINYLKEDGYSVKLEAKTDSFYELYLNKKENTKLKRVIITKNYIVDYNTEIINFNIDDYMK